MAYSAFSGTFTGGGTPLPDNVTLQGNTFNGANELLQLDANGLASPANLPTLDLIRAPAANLSLAGLKIVNLGNPTLGTDAATKAYVDALITGAQIKAAVGNATTANITLSGEQTIDGVLTSTSRILVKNQTDHTQNGIYVTAAGAWARSTDANTGPFLVNASVFVSAGTTQANTGWGVITPSPITIGVSNIDWAQTSASATILAGNGLNKSGNTLNALGTSNRISVNTTIDIAATYVGQSSITTLGTIGTGVWNATPVAIAVGGTAATTANQALNNLLPTQTGHAGQQLTTDGSNTSWQSLSGIYVNVKAAPFNAAGDGTTDDTTAINTAIASLSTGGVCYFPPGNYKVMSSLAIGAKVYIMGSGKDATTILLGAGLGAPVSPPFASAQGVFQQNSKDSWTISDLTIDMNNFQGSGISPILCNFWTVHDIRIINIVHYGVFVNGGKFWSIRNNYIQKTTAAGNYQNQSVLSTDAGGEVSNFDISNNQHVNSGLLILGHDGTISKNMVSGTMYGSGIATGNFDHSNRILISENISHSNRGTDVNATVVGGFQIWGHNHILRGNLAYDNDGDGFGILGLNMTITGNIANDNGVLLHYAGFTAVYIDTNNNASGCVFVGNRGYNSAGAAGPQNYGYEESNNNGLVHITRIGNNFNNNRLGPTHIFSVNNGSDDANISRTFAWTPGTIANASSATISGFGMSSVLGDMVLVSIEEDLQGCSLNGFVPSAGNVSVTITNNSGSSKTFAATTLHIRLIKKDNSPNY